MLTTRKFHTKIVIVR